MVYIIYVYVPVDAYVHARIRADTHSCTTSCKYECGRMLTKNCTGASTYAYTFSCAHINIGTYIILVLMRLFGSGQYYMNTHIGTPIRLIVVLC